MLRAVDQPVRSLAGTVGVAIGEELRLEDGLDDLTQRVMDDRVAKRRGTDLAALQLVSEDLKAEIVIPVAEDAAGVVSMIAPRTTPPDLSRPPDRMSPTGKTENGKNSRGAARGVAGEVSPAPPPESEIPE
jgi:hypothetical protein